MRIPRPRAARPAAAPPAVAPVPAADARATPAADARAAPAADARAAPAADARAAPAADARATPAAAHPAAAHPAAARSVPARDRARDRARLGFRRWVGGLGADRDGADRDGADRDGVDSDGVDWRALGVDSALAAGILALFAIAAGPMGPDNHAFDGGPNWAFLLPAVALLPVALRRSAPLTSVGLVCVSLLLTEWHTDGATATTVAGLIVTYTRAALAPVRQAVLATTALGVCGTTVGLVGPEPNAERWAAVTFGILALLACFFLGRTVFTRRAYTAALEERARVAELNREAAARQAVLDERRRIARELHDMVAHHVSVMGVLATGARRTLRRDPDSADEALKTIEDTGRASLREMRRLLDVLRTDDERAPDEPPPASGVAGLEQLAEQVREAGLDVELTVSGAAPQLEPGLDLTVFRVVQEALTNSLKHAGGARAVVAVEFAVDGVRVTVTDDGHGPAPGNDHLGHGLVGMRERVALYGGTLRTGARSGGGFRVFARLPLDGASVPTTKG